MRQSIRSSPFASPRGRPWPFTLSAFWLCACGFQNNQDCNDAYYADVVEIQFSPAVTNAGNYHVSLDSGPVTGSCDVDVGGTKLLPCSSAHMTIDGIDTNGQVSLSSLRVWFDYAPASMTLTIDREGQAWTSEAIVPTYAMDEPGAKGCGTRKHASVVVSVP